MLSLRDKTWEGAFPISGAQLAAITARTGNNIIRLQNWKWVVRVGIPPNYLDQTWSPNIGIAYIGQLILWRWEEVMTTKRKIDWETQAFRFATGKGPQPLFWRQLIQKKVGLYGYHESVSADPIAIARHPWALKKNEFDSALSAVQDGNVPSVPDDRAHVSAVLGVISGAFAMAAVGTTATGIGAPASIVLTTISGLAGGALGLTSNLADLVDSSHSDAFKSNIKQFRAIYANEAGYRKREVA